ncbi:MAG TPA: PQQ-binding-like beta-propeller repeat protein [Gemmataceae bacterium]|nr:PQQ-binding-like beta-propeller repeat protein [Gemmataceae bacterium]
MSLRSLVLASAFLVAATATAADWPQWRGPTRDGISTETGLLKTWPMEGPPVAWTAKGLGLGFGTPIVVEGKIYGIGSRDGRDGVWAVKEADGKEIWFTEFTGTPKVGGQTNGPGGSPTFANGKLYAVSLGGTLVCMDAASGKEVWKKDYVKDFGGRVPSWGYNDSPLVDGDKVIAAPGGTAAAVVAFKADTGDVIWKTADAGASGGGQGYSSPVKATVAGTPMYVVLLGQSAGLVGVNTDTGKVMWQYKKSALGGTAQIPTPIVKDDLVWLSTAYKGGSAVLKLAPAGADKFDVKEVKTYAGELMNHHGGSVLVNGHLYFGHGQNQGYLACVELKTGDLKWGPEKNAKNLGGGSGSAATVYADGRVYFRFQNGTMVLVDPSPDELKVVSSFKLPPPDVKSHSASWPHPVIANGKMYIRDQNVMYAYDIKAK